MLEGLAKRPSGTEQLFLSDQVVERSRPHPLYAPRFSAYDHLARVAEWSSGGGDE